MSDPVITLGGTAYAIPKLAIKQNRHVEPLAVKHLKFFTSLRDGTSALMLTEEQARDFSAIVYHALTRAEPQLTWEAFENLPIAMSEIMNALPICLEQSGLFKPATEGAPPTGEATPPSTGTAS